MKVRVYLDNSVVSKALENELNELGIEFTPVREDQEFAATAGARDESRSDSRPE